MSFWSIRWKRKPRKFHLSSHKSLSDRSLSWKLWQANSYRVRQQFTNIYRHVVFHMSIMSLEERFIFKIFWCESIQKNREKWKSSWWLDPKFSLKRFSKKKILTLWGHITRFSLILGPRPKDDFFPDFLNRFISRNLKFWNSGSSDMLL